MESKYSKVILKKLTNQYLEDYYKLVCDVQIKKMIEPYKAFVIPEKNEVSKWLESIKPKKDRSDFAIFESKRNQFIGELVINDIQKKSANIRISILTEFHGQGYGFEAVKLAIEYGFQQMGLEEITLSVFNINTVGLSLSKKIGFVEVGQSVFEGFEETLMKIEKAKEPPKKKRFEKIEEV